ncbi:MAG TPA: hypothetical protein VEM32_05740, partial [Geobacteraceae bacterium]|nr:hypothetical protein [Geobacteraceae bacterium]
AGCATSQKFPPLFWPAPPDAPRIQYLTAIKDSTDVEEKASVSLLDLGKKEKGVTPIVKPYGIAVKKGKIYICDTIQAEVVILDLPGKKVATLSGNKGEGRLKKPINVAVDDDGFIYVSDTVRREVLKYTPDGAYLKVVAHDLKPMGIAVDELYLYVLDGEKMLIRLFDRGTGEQVRSFGQEGDERGRLFTPLGIGLDGKGGVYVTNMDGRIIQFDRDGHPLKMFGKLGSSLSEYVRPRSVVLDRDGIMYVVDAGTQDVRMMTEMFQLLLEFPAPGSRGALNVPAGIAVSEENLPYYQQFAEPDFVLERVIFVVSQFGDHKISIYGLGKKKGVDYDALVKERQEEIRKKEEEIDKQRAEKEKKEKEQKEKEQGAPAEGTTAPPAAPDGKK